MVLGLCALVLSQTGRKAARVGVGFVWCHAIIGESGTSRAAVARLLTVARRPHPGSIASTVCFSPHIYLCLTDDAPLLSFLARSSRPCTPG